MTEWKREDDGSDPKHAKLAPERNYRLEPGHAGIYQDGKIHSIDYPDKSRFVRVTGVNLDQHQPHPHRPEVRRGAPDDAAAGDVAAHTIQCNVMPGLVPGIHVFRTIRRGWPGQARP